MAKDKTTLRFWLRTDKPNNDGTSPIHLICQISGQRKYYAIPDMKIFAENWNAKDQESVYLDKATAKKLLPGIDYATLPTSKDITDINRKLESYRKDIEDIETRFELDNEHYNVSKVIDALKKKRQPLARKELPSENFVSFIKQFAKDSTGTHTAGTLKVYTGLATHLEEFEKQKKIKLSFHSLDLSALRSINNFLTQKKTIKKNGEKVSMNNVTAAKYMSTIKSLINYARTIYKIAVNPDYRDFKVSRKESKVKVTLTNDEFLTLLNMDLENNKKLAQVRDVFCFSCACGLRISDLLQLKRDHIQNDIIKVTAAKTGQTLDIPLNEISQSILAKYTDQHRPIPVISNQKTNDYLKELCELAGIDSPVEIVSEHGVHKKSEFFKKSELISIHCARRTFVTLSLEKGMAPQEVMSITGHTSYKSFKRYVDVSLKRKEAVMAKAWGAVKPNHLKAV